MQSKSNRYTIVGPSDEGQEKQESSRYVIQKEPESFIDKMPFGIQQLFKIGLGSTQPMGEAVKERPQSALRGLQDIGEGAKQLYLKGAEYAGIKPSGTEKEYTQKAEKERKLYEQSPASKNYINQLIRENVASAPFYGAMGKVLSSGMHLLPKLLTGGLTGAALKGTEFVPEKDSRTYNILKGGVTGAALPLIPAAIESGIGGIEGLKALGTKIEPLEAQAQKALTQHEGVLAEEKARQAQASLAGVPKDVNALQRESLNHQQQIQEVQSQLGEIQPTLPKNVEEAKLNIDNATIAHEKAANLFDENKKRLDEFLPKNISHDVRAARDIEQIETANRKEISDEFTKLENDWKGRDVKIDNSQKIKEKNDQLMEFIKGHEAHSKEALSLLKGLKELEKAPTSLNASDVLKQYQSVSQYAREARAKSYQPGMNKEEREEWKARFNELDDKVEELGKSLEDSVGPKEMERLSNVRSRWRDEVVPLYKNKIYYQIKKFGRMPDNIIKELRGNEKGNLIIKKIIQDNPDILRNVIGQRYARGEKHVLEPNEEMKDYLGKMPELKNIIDQHQESQSLLSQAKQKMDEAHAHHEEISKNAEKYQTKRSEIEDLQQKLVIVEEHLAKLRQSAARKDISLREKIKAEKELSDLEKAKSKALKKLLILGGAMAVGTGAYKLPSMIKSSAGLVNE